MTGSPQHRELPPARAGRDEAWFEDLFRRSHCAVLAFARRRVPEDADDVVSEVFSVAWRRRDEVPEEPLPWLYRVAHHEVLHSRRGEARRARNAQAAVEHLGPEQTAADMGEHVADRLDSRALIRPALDLLPDADQELLRLWAWEGLEPQEIAYVLGCTRGATRVRLHRALRRLRRAVLAAAPRDTAARAVHRRSHHETVAAVPARIEA
ncbi:MAG: sigma-70 family RNA polymerase sigma factor [Actinobacteria bacterium]|nr:sigma-70 family RNA polymerase sigma factor [Actinomycetota bacterium]